MNFSKYAITAMSCHWVVSSFLFVLVQQHVFGNTNMNYAFIFNLMVNNAMMHFIVSTMQNKPLTH